MATAKMFSAQVVSRSDHLKALRRLDPVLVMLLIFFIWEWAVWQFTIPQLLLPAPSAILLDIWTRRALYVAFSIPTLLEIVAGFAAAAVVGCLLGVTISFSAAARRVAYPLLVASQMIPKVAIAPVLIIWFGTGFSAKVLIAFLIAFFPIMVSTMVGIAAVDSEMVRMFRSMGAGKYRTFIKLRLPAALPNIFAGLKVGISLAVVGAIVAEFVAADRGLGYLLIYANGQLDTVGVFSALFLLSVIGVALFYIVEAVERALIPRALTKEIELSQTTM